MAGTPGRSEPRSVLDDLVINVNQQLVPTSVPPRVLMFHTTLPGTGRKPGGVEIAVHRLANALHDMGVSISVASLDPAPSDARYRHHRLFARQPWLRDSRIGRLLILPWLLNFMDVRDVDAVHFHGDDWFVWRRPRATVRTLHGSALREAQSASRFPRRILQYLLVPLERLAAQLATISVAVGRDAASLHGMDRVIGNGFDPGLFRAGSKSDSPLLLYVGTWGGRKRGRWMYELFVNEISPRVPEARLHFITDGSPPPHPRVQLDRFPDDQTLAAAYRAAWIFVLPSTYEGFGIPYLEAMASGTAIVATPNVGANALLGGGRYGRLSDDDDFAETVVALLGDVGERNRLASAGLERAGGHTWTDVGVAYLQVYRDAIGVYRDKGSSG